MASPKLLLNYINGRWAAAAALESRPVTNPATAATLAEVPLSGAAEVDAAVRAGIAAFEPEVETGPGSGEPHETRCDRQESFVADVGAQFIADDNVPNQRGFLGVSSTVASSRIPAQTSWAVRQSVGRAHWWRDR